MKEGNYFKCGDFNELSIVIPATSNWYYSISYLQKRFLSCTLSFCTKKEKGYCNNLVNKIKLCRS